MTITSASATAPTAPAVTHPHPAPSPRAVWIAHTLLIIDDEYGPDNVDALLADPRIRTRLFDLYALHTNPADAADTLIEENF